jgi:hypothetical protein
VALSFVLPLVNPFLQWVAAKAKMILKEKYASKNKNQFQEAQKRAPITQKLIREIQLLGNWKSSTQAMLK